MAALQAQQAAAAEQMEIFAASDVAVVSDFESETTGANFGSAWEVTTDTSAGGNSVAEIEIVADGANGTYFSLLVTGEVGDAVPFAWSGVIYMPGTPPFSPFDLSSKPTLNFWAKGEGGPFRIQLFCEGVAQTPPEQPIDVGTEWQEFAVDLSTFEGCNVAGVQAIIFSAGPTPGQFSLQIDEASFE